MENDVWSSVLDTLTESQLNCLENEAFLQCAIRGKLIYSMKRALIFRFTRLVPQNSLIVTLFLYSKDDPFEDLTQSEWERLDNAATEA